MAFKGRKQSKLIRCMKGPIRILARARDLYFLNMSSSGVHVLFGGVALSCPTPKLGSLSTNASVSSSKYATSSGGYSRRSSPMIRRAPAAAPVPRSHSVPIGPIDEDKSCHFGVDDEPEVVYPKTRSCAINRRSSIRF